MAALPLTGDISASAYGLSDDSPVNPESTPYNRTEAKSIRVHANRSVTEPESRPLIRASRRGCVEAIRAHRDGEPRSALNVAARRSRHITRHGSRTYMPQIGHD